MEQWGFKYKYAWIIFLIPVLVGFIDFYHSHSYSSLILPLFILVFIGYNIFSKSQTISSKTLGCFLLIGVVLFLGNLISKPSNVNANSIIMISMMTLFSFVLIGGKLSEFKYNIKHNKLLRAVLILAVLAVIFLGILKTNEIGFLEIGILSAASILAFLVILPEKK